MKKIKNLSAIQLIALCMATISVLWICKNTVYFVMEKTGAKTEVLSADDFELVGIIKDENGNYVSTDSDPQLILKKDMKIARVSIVGEFSVNPGEMVVYYTQKEGQGFAPHKRYWIYKESDSNTYTASMPLKKLKSLRIDPTTFAGNTMQIKEIVLNKPKAFIEYFKPTFSDIFNLIVFSCVISSIICLLKDLFKSYDIKS